MQVVIISCLRIRNRIILVNLSIYLRNGEKLYSCHFLTETKNDKTNDFPI